MGMDCNNNSLHCIGPLIRIQASRKLLLLLLIFVFFHPFYDLRPSFSLSLLVVTQIRGHIAGPSPPVPTKVCALYFYCQKISDPFSLIDSRRILLTHAPINRRSQP